MSGGESIKRLPAWQEEEDPVKIEVRKRAMQASGNLMQPTPTPTATPTPMPTASPIEPINNPAAPSGLTKFYTETIDPALKKAGEVVDQVGGALRSGAETVKDYAEDAWYKAKTPVWEQKRNRKK
jgi:hypothetical protein